MIYDWSIDYVCQVCGSGDTIVYETEEKPTAEDAPDCPNGCCRMTEMGATRVATNREKIEEEKSEHPEVAPFWNRRHEGEAI